MKTLKKIAILIVISLPLTSYGVSINGSYQSTTTNKHNQMTQEKGKGNTQALNNLTDSANSLSIHGQTVDAKKDTSMTQNKGKKNTQALNNATVGKNTIVIQKANLNKLKMKQMAGKDNVQAVNNLNIKKK